MALYSRIRTVLEIASNSDYYKPEMKQEFSITGTPSYRVMESFSAATTGTTLNLGTHTTFGPFVVVNKDATNYVYLDYYQRLGTQAAGSYNFANANPDTITDNAAGGTFLTNGCANGDYVIVSGSENSGENDGTFLVQTAAADTLTLAATEALTANALDTTASLVFARKNRIRINAGHYAVLPQQANISGDILITANTSAVEVEIWGSAT